MTLKVKVNDPHINTSWDNPNLRCTVGVHLVILAQIYYNFFADEPNFLEFWVNMAKITLKVRANVPQFQYQLKISQDLCLGQIWRFQPKSVPSYRADKTHFLKFWVNIAKMTLKVKVIDLYFHNQRKLSHDACLVQIWWVQLRSVRNYRVDRVNITDGQTDRRTRARTDGRKNTSNDNAP